MPFLPREKKFFDLYESLAEKIIQSIELFEKLVENYNQLPKIAENLNKLEDEADEIVHQIISDLHYDHTRVTEEKGDIRFFVHNMDNIVDALEKAINRLYIYRIPVLPQAIKEFLPLLKETTQKIQTGVNCLRNLRKNDKILADCIIKINDLENVADEVNRRWLSEIINEKEQKTKDFREVIALKEIIDLLEYAMDQCEDVANLLEVFRLKGEA